jgi:hypothetical protein
VTINHHITLLGIRVSVRGNFVPDELSPALLLLFLILPYLQLQNLKLVLLLKIGSPTQTYQNQVLVKDLPVSDSLPTNCLEQHE